MNKLRTATVVISALAGLPLLLSAQVPPDAGLQVDRIFAPWSSVDSPGCAVGVSKDGLTIFSRGYGMADLEHDVPNTAETIFEGGSLSKQFTATAIMLLVMDGKLSLDDDVRDYVPEVPDYGTKITLRHMMTHTSGLRDWGSVAEISGWGRGERSHDHSDVIDIVSRQSALNFEPGHEYSFRVEDGRLTIWQRPDVTTTLTPIYAAGFRAGEYIYRFRTDSAGRVVALSLSRGRVYDMRFERVGSD